MTELVAYGGNDAASKLVQWAEAASAAEALARQLCKTAFVPETFRLSAGETDETRRDNDIRIGNATAALLLGAELGLDPIASLRALYVIRGQVAIYARMKLALLLSRGHRVWTEFESDERIVVAGHRKDDEEHVQRVSWDVARAQRAGFTRNDLYRSNPRAMLFARASSELASRLAPDVLAGIPEDTAEELGARLSVSEDAPASSVTVQRSPRAESASGRLLAPVPVVDAPAPDVPNKEDSRRRAVARARAEKTAAERELLQIPPKEAPAEAPAKEEPTADVVDVAERTQEEELPLELPEEEPKITGSQRAMMHALFREQNWDQETYREFTRQTLGRKLDTTAELTVTEASLIIDRMKELAGESDAVEDVGAH